MKKIALAVISRDTEDDAKLLKRLLENTKDHIDGFFVTAAYTEFPGHVKKVCEEYGANYSEFKWIKDFSAARNFNFNQVTKDYDYIMWSDIDDEWSNLDLLKSLLEKNKDAYAFWYYYGFDEDEQPNVVHKKTMIIKNDDSFEWAGRIHEDLMPLRQIDIDFNEKVERIHRTSDNRIGDALVRNLEIAKLEYDENPTDPRNSFNLANSYSANGEHEEAIKLFEEFLETSGSPEEKYLVLNRLAWAYFQTQKNDRAVKALQLSIGMQPKYPDAYLELGKLFWEIKNYDECIRYTKEGLLKEPSYKAVSVFNPRDYDYNPTNLLAKAYFAKNRPDLALTCIKTCLKINRNPRLIEIEKELTKEMDEINEVGKLISKIIRLKTKDELKEALDNIPDKYKSHPGICSIRNKLFIKTESSGKDVTFYCGGTNHEWNPELFEKKGFGGSEEAIIHLSRQLAKKGMNVEVYANVGPTRVDDNGIIWKPYWEFNYRDKTDYLILWRSAKVCDYKPNATKVFIDVHDTIPEQEFTKERLEVINKIFVKTKAHRDLYPNIPDEKFAVIPNGLKIDDFDGEVKKDPLLIINTSSPDRSLSALAKIFTKVKEKEPEAVCLWAYGWDLFDDMRKNDPRAVKWADETKKAVEDAGIVSLGKIKQSEVAELYKKANVMLYPTEFYEIDCISVKKAQLAGCNVVTTDFAALDESVQKGVKIHSKKTKKDWAKPYQLDFASDDSLIDSFVDETLKALKKEENKEAREWAKKYNWDEVGTNWYNELYAS